MIKAKTDKPKTWYELLLRYFINTTVNFDIVDLLNAIMCLHLRDLGRLTFLKSFSAPKCEKVVLHGNLTSPQFRIYKLYRAVTYSVFEVSFEL